MGAPGGGGIIESVLGQVQAQVAQESERKAKVGAASYARIADMAKINYSSSIDYGKWLVGTLFLMDAGIIAGLRDRLNTTLEIASIAISVAASITLGLVLWIHFGLHFRYWSSIQNEAIVLSFENFDKSKTPSIWIKRTLYMAFACGIVSGIAAVITLIPALSANP